MTMTFTKPALAAFLKGDMTAVELSERLGVTPRSAQHYIGRAAQRCLIKRVAWRQNPRKGPAKPFAVYGITDLGRDALDGWEDNTPPPEKLFVESVPGIPLVEQALRSSPVSVWALAGGAHA